MDNFRIIETLVEVAYALERGTISRTLAASDIRKLVAALRVKGGRS